MAKVPDFKITREGYYSTRIRAGRKLNADGSKGKSQQLRITIRTRDHEVFLRRYARLTELSRRLTPKGLTSQAAIIVRNAAEAESDVAFEYCVGRADGLAAPLPARPTAGPGRWRTFEDLADDHAGGELSRLYPSHAPSKASIGDDKGKLATMCAARDDVYGTIGQVPIDKFTVEHALTVMGQLPPTVKRDTTRNSYWQVLHRVMELAVFPCRLIPSNPILREHRPKIRDGKIKYPYLFPAEDFLMLRYDGPVVSEGVALASLELQALYGCLNREGARISEFIGSADEKTRQRHGGLLWTGIDVVNGRVNVGVRKNGRTGEWPAQPGTIEVLLALRELVPGLAALPGPFYGLPLDEKYAARLIALLKASGVTRHELLHSGDGRGRLRAHDTRATFVTLCKALGLSDSFIQRHTGHEHSSMLARYDHARDDWRHHRLGKLVRLDVAMGRERLGLTAIDLDAERARLAAKALDPEGETESETDSPVIVRHTVPAAWLSSQISLVPKTGLEPVHPCGRRILNPLDRGSEGVDQELSTRSPVAQNHGKAPVVSPEPEGVRQNFSSMQRFAEAPDPLLDSLQAAARVALDARDWTTVAALGQLIDKHLQALAAEAKRTASHAVISLVDARLRRDDRGDQ